ncbi:conserved hypothetical protein [Hyella patelloides LEGE 07179]|uniref:ADP-heptose:LPS heptosyltransferase n=1 Tax=Hyella patelloides LEGE 07179 TaxID=945734 RepID=A0A563W429_9CYAN|nr:hypothetical protein [Hyella patelloides]VEP18303.1 conserved hypothetical protein [Hyella patelloides LEGE 07179]
MSKRTLLINWLYYHPVGHAVEGFAVAAEYYAANPDLEIHLLLNSRTPVELAKSCSWVAKCYPIDVDEIAIEGELANCLQELSKDWDYIVYSRRWLNPKGNYSQKLINSHNIINNLCKARLWQGIRGEPGQGNTIAPDFRTETKFKMSLPESARRYAKQFKQQNLIFSILLAGSSSEKIYPQIRWWKLLFQNLNEAFPQIRLLVLGHTKSKSGRTTTHTYCQTELEELFSTIPNAINCYDTGIFNQLALIELSDLFISPHTGFAFLAPSVGTRWLAISGVRWPDPTYANMPFYSVLPPCPQYPCFQDMKLECRTRICLNQSVSCMDKELDLRIPEVIEGAKHLLNPDFDLSAAIETYRTSAVKKNVNLDRLYTLKILEERKMLW